MDGSVLANDHSVLVAPGRGPPRTATTRTGREGSREDQGVAVEDGQAVGDEGGGHPGGPLRVVGPARQRRPGRRTGPRRRASTRRPRPWRSEPSKRDWPPDTPGGADRRVGRRPDASHAQDGVDGTLRATRRRGPGRPLAPRSSIAWFHAQPCPAGTTASVGRAGPRRARSGRPAWRARIRATLVSTTPTSRSPAKARTARAVYGPMPGRARSAARSQRQPAPVIVDHGHRAPVQRHRPAVVAEAGPGVDDVADGGRGTGRRVGEPVQEGVPLGDDPVDLGLLQHHLRHEHRPRVPGPPPRQVPPLPPRHQSRTADAFSACRGTSPPRWRGGRGSAPDRGWPDGGPPARDTRSRTAWRRGVGRGAEIQLVDAVRPTTVSTVASCQLAEPVARPRRRTRRPHATSGVPVDVLVTVVGRPAAGVVQ